MSNEITLDFDIRKGKGIYDDLFWEYSDFYVEYIQFEEIKNKE